MSEEAFPVTCIYCGNSFSSVEIRLHVYECAERPEKVLLTRIQLLTEAGDAMLEILRSMTKSVTAVEGMRTKAWEIYHDSELFWNNAKNYRE